MDTPPTPPRELLPVEIAVVQLRSIAQQILQRQQDVERSGVPIQPHLKAFDEEVARLIWVASDALEAGDLS